jgi:histidine ammonia-lyase
VSEHKTLAHPASVDSIPTSANQEDHVSMGATSARHARRVLEGVERILAIELLAATQALDLRLDLLEGAGDNGGTPSPGRGVIEAQTRVRAVVAHLESDREPEHDLATAFGLISGGKLADLAGPPRG